MRFDTTNKQRVVLTTDDRIVVGDPRRVMSREDALVHAAWIVVTALDGYKDLTLFNKAVNAVLDSR